MQVVQGEVELEAEVLLEADVEQGAEHREVGVASPVGAAAEGHGDSAREEHQAGEAASAREVEVVAHKLCWAISIDITYRHG